MKRYLLPLLVLSAAVHADEKWNVTVNMAMTGMPFPIPQQTHTVCVAPGEQNRTKMIPTEDGCTTSNVKTTGNSMSAHIECPPPKKMSGDVKVTYTGNSYKGEMTARGDFDGHPGDMKITYAGKKIGSCSPGENTVTQANAMMAQQQAQMAQIQGMQANYNSMACAQVANEMNIQAEAYMTAMCPTIKTDICKVFARKSADPAALRQLKLEKGDDWVQVASYCGADINALSAQACTSAKSQQKWLEATEFCGEDSELAAVAAKECTGLKFTSMSQSDPRRNYQPLCAKYAVKARSEGGVLDTGKKAIDGVNKLRGVFGF